MTNVIIMYYIKVFIIMFFVSVINNYSDLLNEEIKIKKKTFLMISIFNFVNTKICSKLLGNPPLVLTITSI